MDNRERLLDGGNAESRALLESALRDRPPASGLERTALALGLSDLAVPPHSLDAAAATTAAVATKASLFASTGKFLAIGLFAGSAASVAGFAVQRATTMAPAPEARPMAFEPATAPRAAPDVPSLRPTPLASAPTTVNELAPPPLTPLQPRVVSARPSPSPAPRPAEPSALTRETALVDALRGALRRGDNGAARAALAAYDAERRLGVLDREVLLLSVELALSEGARDRALNLAAAFEAKYPNDVHLPRLRELLAK